MFCCLPVTRGELILEGLHQPGLCNCKELTRFPFEPLLSLRFDYSKKLRNPSKDRTLPLDGNHFQETPSSSEHQNPSPRSGPKALYLMLTSIRASFAALAWSSALLLLCLAWLSPVWGLGRVLQVGWGVGPGRCFVCLFVWLVV